MRKQITNIRKQITDNKKQKTENRYLSKFLPVKLDELDELDELEKLDELHYFTIPLFVIPACSQLESLFDLYPQHCIFQSSILTLIKWNSKDFERIKINLILKSFHRI